MENQHKKIKGYRDLSEDEIALMNEVKEHAEATAALLEKVGALRDDQNACLHNKAGDTINGLTHEDLQESYRCLMIAKKNLQQGQMWFVRSIALPQSF